MPSGVLVWFDPRSGEGRVRRNGREYPVSRADIESDARVPMARIHFDIRREEGVQRAVNVTLRRGSRVSPHQHRFGDLAGAHHPDEKGHHPLTDDHPGTDPMYEGRPLELAEEWARLVNIHDLPTLRLLYAPEAVLHVGSKTVKGRDAIIEWMADEIAQTDLTALDIAEKQGVVKVELSGRDTTRIAEFRVAHGRVVEQWM